MDADQEGQLTEVQRPRLADPASAFDVARAAANLAAGFSDDPVLTWAFSSEGRAPKLAAFFEFLAREELVGLGATWLLDGCCASWTPPDPKPWADDMSARFGALLTATCPADDIARLGALSASMSAVHPHEPHWYLGLIGTSPAERGRGLGAAVLGASLAVVDGEGMPAYLESTNPRNVSLYLRHGFEVTGTIEVPDGPSLTAMWRPAGVLE